MTLPSKVKQFMKGGLKVAKDKIDRDLEEAARGALKKALETEEHTIKEMVWGAIEEAIKEYRKGIHQTMLEMAPTTDDVVGTCDVCQALVKAKNLKKIATVGHQDAYISSQKDMWLFMCSVCAKTLEEKGGISRVLLTYQEIYSTAPVEKGVIEKQEKS